VGPGGCFFAAESFNQPLNWNVSKVQYLAGIFEYANSFNQSLNWYDFDDS
jgi:hypothetical protein